MRRTLIVLALVAASLAACSGSGATVSPAAGGGTPGPASTPATAAGTARGSAAATAAGTPAPTHRVSASAGTTTGTLTGAPASPAACSLLTNAEAAAALGVPVNAGAPAVDPTENVCSFGGHALADMVKFVEIEVVNPVEFTPTRASVPGTFLISAAPGIGEVAYYQKVFLPNGSGTRISLSVRKGQTVIRLDVVIPGAPDASIETAEKSLALAALTRF